MKKPIIAIMCLLAVSGIASYAHATEGNRQNCLEDESLVLFSGTDAGAVRRGLNLGVYGCYGAGQPRDLPTYVDTNYLTPGATHVIPAIGTRPQTSPPGTATFRHQDGTTVSITWRWATDPQTNRWEGQSIALKPGAGTVQLTALGRSVTYEKVQ